MAYVAPVHKATSIRNALRIRLGDNVSPGLVIACVELLHFTDEVSC